MSVTGLFLQTKKYVLYQMGFLDESAAPKPREPVKPVGKLRAFNNWVKLFALLGLCGYFVYLLISVISNYLNDVANPPLKVSQSLAKKPNEPFLPAVAFCNTGFNRSIKLLQAGFQEQGNVSSTVFCYPEPGNDNCDDGFPIDQLQYWKFSVRHEDYTGGSGRRLVGSALYAARSRHSMPMASTSRNLQYEGDVLPDTNGDFDVHCIAMDATQMPGFYPRKEPRSKQLMMLFAYEQAPTNIDYVQTSGLKGLDVFFFNDAMSLPGLLQQDPTSVYGGLFNSTSIVSADAFLDNAKDNYVLGQNSLTYMTISQSQYTENGQDTTYQYNARSMAAELNTDNFINTFNPEVNNTADDLQLSFIVLGYDSPMITYYTRDPPNFAEFLGSIGGLKSILTEFWAMALIALASINQMQAMTKRKDQKTAVVANTSGPKDAKDEQIAVVAGDEEGGE